MEDIIYTDKPLDIQIDTDKIQHIYNSLSTQLRAMAYITHKYEQAVNKGKAYIIIRYEYTPCTHKAKMPMIKISDTDAQVELTRIIKTRASTHRRSRRTQ